MLLWQIVCKSDSNYHFPFLGILLLCDSEVLPVRSGVCISTLNCGPALSFALASGIKSLVLCQFLPRLSSPFAAIQMRYCRLCKL